MAKQKPKRASRSQSLWWVAGIAVVAAAALIGLAVMSARPGAQTPETVKTDAELGAERNVMGKATAKVRVVEFGDYLCPHCADAYKAVEPKLAPLIAQGQVSFEFRNAIVVDPVRSQWGAEAAECAADQGKFWAYHSMLLENQQPPFTKDRLKEFAKTLGLDTAAFNQCLDSGKYTAKVKESTQAAQKLGVRGTPTFMINDKIISIRSFDDVIRAVEEEVKK